MQECRIFEYFSCYIKVNNYIKTAYKNNYIKKDPGLDCTVTMKHASSQIAY